MSKTKGFFNHCFEVIQKQRFPSWINNWTLAFSVLFLAGLHVANYYQYVPSLYLIISLLFYVLSGLILSFLIVWSLQLFSFLPAVLKVAILFAFLWIFYYLRIPKAYGGILMVGLILFPIFILYGCHRWRKAAHSHAKKRQILLWISLALAASTALIISAVLFFNSGARNAEVINYKMTGNLPPPLDLPNPATKGTYKSAHMYYGSGTDKHRPEFGAGVKIRTKPVDASRILTSWTGISGKLRSQYFGFDQTALPLNAQVWYPENKMGPLPLVMIVHGNHLAQHASDAGYTYLGELLASRGYLVAAIDENFLNSSFTDLEIFGQQLSNENAARAWILLKHLQLFRNWNKDSSHLFYHRVDMDKIAIIGHSRGGEAVELAAVFNKLSRYPDDANELFDFNFNIQSVIAIAPVDGQYKPSGELIRLRDVNYFVIQGALDLDIQSYVGLAMYKRVEFSKDFKGFKAGLYINKANHGQFNSSWGRKDEISPGINRFNLHQLMSGPKQRIISRVYISAFLEITLNKNEKYKPLFMDERYGRNWLPQMIYMNQYEPSEKTVLADFEEDVDVQTTTLSGGHITSSGLQEWKEQENELIWGQGLSKAVYLAWDSTGKAKSWYSIRIANSSTNPAPMHILSFSLANGRENSKDKEQLIDFTIQLEDSQGQRISFPLSRCSYLQPRISKDIGKFRIFNNSPNSEAIPDYFYFDLTGLAKANPAFHINELKQIKFLFDRTKSGSIVLDDIFLTA